MSLIRFSFPLSFSLSLSLIFYGLIWEREREKETSICCSTYWCIHWLIPVCALTGDWTCNFNILGRRSIQLSYPARASLSFFLFLPFFPSCLFLTYCFLFSSFSPPSFFFCSPSLLLCLFLVLPYFTFLTSDPNTIKAAWCYDFC